MKDLWHRRGGVMKCMGSLLLVYLLAGCATTPKVDWNARIGNYTYDQAVIELGPPDKVATLTDGTKVAEWLRYRGYSHGYITSGGPYFHYPYFFGPPAFFYSEPPAPDRFLRLTFSPEGRLVAWQKVYR